MTLRSLAVLGLVFGLAACQVPIRVADPVTPKTAVRPKASVGPSASPSVSTSPSVSPSPTSSPASLVAASTSPAVKRTATTILKGVIRLDAHYIVAAGAGNVISNNAGSVLAVKGGTLISNNGSNLVVPAAGGQLISAGGANMRVLQADALTVGQLLPAQGVAVLPVSMVTGKPLGDPVLTDDTGAYAVAIPQTVQENVRLVSALPAAKADDPILQDSRFQYSLITGSSGSEAAVIDEDTALTSQFLRYAYTQRLLQFLTLDDSEKALSIITTAILPDFLKPQMMAVLQELRSEAKAAGIDGMTPADQLAMAQRVNDTVLSRLDLATLTVESKFESSWKLPPEPALPVLVDIMKRNREKAAEKLTQEPTFFDAFPFLTEATIVPGFKIKRPSDFNDFLVKEYFVRNEIGVYPKAFNAMETIGALMDDQTGLHYGERMEAAGNSILGHQVQAIFTNKNGAKDAAIAAIRAK